MKLGTYRDNLLWRRGASPVRFWNRAQRHLEKFGFGLNDERKRSAVTELGWTLAIIDQTLLGVRRDHIEFVMEAEVVRSFDGFHNVIKILHVLGFAIFWQRCLDQQVDVCERFGIAHFCDAAFALLVEVFEARISGHPFFDVLGRSREFPRKSLGEG